MAEPTNGQQEMVPLSQVDLTKRVVSYAGYIAHTRDPHVVMAKMLVHIEAIEHRLESLGMLQEGPEMLVPSDSRRLKDWFGVG